MKILLISSIAIICAFSLLTRMSASAQSIGDQTSVQAAQIALDAFRMWLQKMDKSATIEQMAQKENALCDNAAREVKGSNSSGDFVAFFLGADDNRLSCDDPISDIRFIQVIGRFSGNERSIGARIADTSTPAVECGRASGESYGNSKLPVGDLCEKGSPSPVAQSTDGKKWVWLCIDGDASVSCSANVSGSGAVGECGPAARNYTSQETSFSGSMCSIGDPRPVSVDFPAAGQSVSWHCLMDDGESDACIARRQSSDSNFDCSLITGPGDAPDGYGPPFNMLSLSRESLLTVSCEPGNVRASAGSAAVASMFVYNKGFVYSGGTWESVSFSGNAAQGNPGWISGVAASSVLPASSGSSSNFVIAFICQFRDGSWKCGCRDGECAGNFWTIQKY